MSLRDRLLETDLVAEQNPSFLYDKVTMDAWAANMPNLIPLLDFRPLPRRYKSNWRILHIDGFEEKTLQFLHFTPMDVYTGPDLRRVQFTPAPELRSGQRRLRYRDES